MALSPDMLDAETAQLVRAAAGIGPDEPVDIFEVEEIDEARPTLVKRLIKAAAPEEQRFCLGIVLEPTLEMNQPDSQLDVYSAAEVEKAAHDWMEDYQQLGVQHKEKADARIKVLESFIQRGDTEINGQTVKSGTWCLAVRVVDDQLWADVKSGAFTGFSIGGVANRQPLA